MAKIEKGVGILMADENRPGFVFYQSTIAGITQLMVDAPIVYYGFTFRHGRQVDEATDLEHEMLARVDRLLDGGLKDCKGARFVVNGFVERYEVFDVDSSDMLVMYRIPCSSHEDVVTSPNVTGIELVCHPSPYPQTLMDRVSDLDVNELLALKLVIDALLAAKVNTEMEAR